MLISLGCKLGYQISRIEMLSAEGHSWIFTFLIGIIVLVMAGVGLSLVIDRRLEFSSGVVEIRSEINLDAMELEHLTTLHDERSCLLNETGLTLQTEARDRVCAKLEALDQRQAVLGEMRRQLGKAISSLEEDFSQCRANYRQRVRRAAIGEPLGNLVLRSGREYQQAVITRVTDVGLEIRHAGGMTRVQAPDLDQKMQDRFQWNDEARKQILKGETEVLADRPDGVIRKGVVPLAGIAVPAIAVERHPETRSASESAELPLLRRMVVGWRSKVTNLSAERAEAQSRASYGSQTSVPGSLETWKARAERVGADLARAQSALALAVANLAAVDPHDPLLSSLPRGY